MATRAESDNDERFRDRYRLCCSPVRLEVERAALGTDFGSTGYTTRAQAHRIADALRLGPGVRLADIGSGSGWPGLYLATTTGCWVVGTDLPRDGLQHASERAVADGADDRAGYIQATGRHQPLRSGAFDAVVHTDVLCCLAPKESVLRECWRILRPGGRLAFTTIHVAPALDRRSHRRAVRAGPWHVATRRPYREMVERAGFADGCGLDVTEDYARTQRSWLEATEARADELRRLTSDEDFAIAQADRRRTGDAIGEGLLRRTLITAVRP